MKNMLKDLDSINVSFEHTYNVWESKCARRIDFPAEAKIELKYQNGQVYTFLSFLKTQLPLEIDWNSVAETYTEEPDTKCNMNLPQFFIDDNCFKISSVHHDMSIPLYNEAVKVLSTKPKYYEKDE